MAFNTQYIDVMSDHVDFYVGDAPETLESVFGDGETYSDNLYFQSPEGNFYGQTMVVREFYVPIVWDGEQYVKVKPTLTALSISQLPATGSQHFEQVAIPRTDASQEEIDRGYTDDVYFWDTVTQEWIKVEWLWNIDKPQNIPVPGMGVGKAHIFIRYNQQMIWDGYKWKPWPPHSNIVDDEPDRHLSEGFITNYENYQTNTNGAIQFLQSQQAEARLEFLSKTSLGLLTSVPGKTGALWVNNELLLVSGISSVESTDNVLQYSNGTITNDTVDPNTEYYVYCGNSDFTACSSGLFLSQTPDINGRLGDELPGLNARIVGVVETDSAGYFVREIDMSYIGRKVEFSETFWEYSDFQLQFVDEDNLAFNRIDGTHGLCYINGQLLYLGTGKDLNRADYRIEWNDGPDVDTGDISASTTYQVYIANDSVEYNFNNEDSETGLPYEEGHEDYISALDFRRQLFLSTQLHDHRVFNQEYPGYYARHVGQISTDENGLFKYSADISLIRQPTLNPTHLDGLAECVIQDVSTTQFKVIRKKGTTGIVYVGGKPVQTYDSDNPLVHIITTSDPIYDYDETELDEPLADSGITVAEKSGVSIYVYLANDIDAWQGITTFCSLEAPHGGYLSVNWPGNQARWLATIQLSPATLGSEKVTNGSFATDTAWTKGTGWSYSSPNQNMVHATGNTATLSQDVSAVAGELYACTFYITGRTAGIAAPRVGGTSGQSISGNTSSTQYLLATTDGDLEIVPDTYFDGSVDNVSVKKVTAGQFSGTYVKDSVGGVSAQIDDSIVSTSTTYSSNKIEQIRQQLLSKINLALGLNGSHTSGLDLQLEYVNSTTIKLKAINADVDVIFPNLETVTVTTAGITKTVTGSINTFYYVYLVTDGTLAILTNAPTDEYSSISFYGETHVLVGWMGFSATNTIAGNWNVYSFWNQPQQTWSKSVSAASTTYLDTMLGMVVPSGKTATLVYSGSMSTTYGWSFSWPNCSTSATASITGVGSNSSTGPCCCVSFNQYTGQPYSSISCTLTHNSFGAGVHNLTTEGITVSLAAQRLIYLSSDENCSGCIYQASTANYSPTSTSASGTITLTLPGS
jgi:hypothetical protein